MPQLACSVYYSCPGRIWQPGGCGHRGAAGRVAGGGFVLHHSQFFDTIVAMTQSFERVNDIADVAERRPTFLAVGVFDGVHRGHQHLLQRMVAEARAGGARPGVLTFFPHPKAVIQNLQGRIYLTTLEERLRLLAAQGVELVIVHPFNDEVRHTRAADFVDRLVAYLDLRQLWGGSFSLGYRREGTAEFLADLGQVRGFTVRQIRDLVMWNGERVSSSRVRRELAEGDIASVNGGLGRPFCVSGEVVMGDQRGRTIGFPTANLAVWAEQLLPANGVYVTQAWLGAERFMAATNVGVRPTVNGHHVSVEAHLLDFDRDIYGAPLRLEFLGRIRAEQKFPGLDALRAQIRQDVDQVRAQLS